MHRNEVLQCAYGHCPRDIPCGTAPAADIDVWCGRLDVMLACAIAGFIACMVVIA